MSNVLFSINDPIHGLMQFRREEANLLKRIISTAEVQRLRYIKQLGMAFFVYPGANHNRLSHSLGASYLAKRLVEKLIADTKGNGDLKAAKELAIVAALLHDVGHGPYSHMFERAKYGSLKFNHEEMTLLIIDRLSSLASLKDYKDVLTHASKILSKKLIKGEDQIVSSLISSQLDVDRMDYLLRDSHFCGVDYGNYDRKWLIHGIQYCKKNNEHIIGINRKAIGVLEHYLMGRRLMTNCVYKHPKIVASEHLLACLIEEIYTNLELFSSNNLFKDQPIIKYLKTIQEKQDFKSALDDYLQVTDVDVELIFKCISISDNHKDESFKMISDRIFRREFPETYEIDSARYHEVNGILNDFKENNPNIKSWQLKLDDREIKTYKDSNKKIYVIDRCENLKTIDSVSLPILSMTNKNEVNPILIIDKEILNLPSIKSLKEELDKKGCLAVCGESLVR